jgi:Lar family restriction alleviation protein
MKPCPFCGVVPKYDTRNGIVDLESRAREQYMSSQVVCLNCGACGPESEFQDDAKTIAVWNQRAETTR